MQFRRPSCTVLCWVTWLGLYTLTNLTLSVAALASDLSSSRWLFAADRILQAGFEWHRSSGTCRGCIPASNSVCHHAAWVHSSSGSENSYARMPGQCFVSGETGKRQDERQQLLRVAGLWVAFILGLSCLSPPTWIPLVRRLDSFDDPSQVTFLGPCTVTGLCLLESLQVGFSCLPSLGHVLLCL